MNDLCKIFIINYSENDKRSERLISQIKKYNIPYVLNSKITKKDCKSIAILDANYVYENDLIKYILGTDFEKKNVLFKGKIKRIYDIDKYLDKTIEYEKANIKYFYLSKEYEENIISKIDKDRIYCDISLVNTNELVPIEDYDKNRVLNLKKKIESEKIWNSPLIIEKNNMLILDGHHRFETSKLLNLKKVPAILIEYKKVKVWSLRKNFKLNKREVIKNAKESKIYPYKTVKHKFPFKVPELNIKIGDLK